MHSPAELIAVDVGNSRIKLGHFVSVGDCATAFAQRLLPIAPPGLPEPVGVLQLPLDAQRCGFDEENLNSWIDELPPGAPWFVASVNRPAADRLEQHMATRRPSLAAPRRLLTWVDLPLEVRLPEPARVGVDRLAAALAAGRLRRADRGAIIVDHGTAITVDLVDAEGAFVGGAILAGTTITARALAEYTDALPLVAAHEIKSAPEPLGDATVAAIHAGLYWGALGAVREVVAQIAARQEVAPDVFVTGGAAVRLAEHLAQTTGLSVRHIHHLVLAGIALAAEQQSTTAP